MIYFDNVKEKQEEDDGEGFLAQEGFPVRQRPEAISDMQVEERFRVKAPIQSVWEFMLDPERIGPCIPGCERIDVVGENVYQSTARVKVGFMAVTMKSRTTIMEADPPHYLKSVTDGRDALKSGTFHQESEVHLTETSEGEVEVSYSANTRVVGKLGTFGEKIMRATARKLGEQFARNIQTALEDPSSRPTDA